MSEEHSLQTVGQQAAERSSFLESTSFRSLLFWLAALSIFALALWGGWFGPPGEHVWRFIGLWLLIGAVSLGLLILLPEEWTSKRRLWTILALAFVCRLGLLPHPASDDVNRYVWEGRIFVEGYSPYSHPPDDPELIPLRDEAIWPGINHKDQAGCYPPLMLLLFSALSLIQYGFLPVKVMVIAFDLLAVYLLIALLRERGANDRWVLLYALNPVVLFGFAGQAHLDAAHVAALCAALYFHAKGRWRLMFLMLGLAVQAKYVAVLAVPFMLRKDNLRHAWIGVVVALGPLFAFAWWDGFAMFDSLTNFAARMAFGGSVHALLRVLLGEITPATIVCAIAYGAVYVWCLLRFMPRLLRGENYDVAAPLLLSYGALLVLSPTVHFWYLAWLLPFVVLRPGASWTILSFSIAFYFIAVGNQYYGNGWTLPWPGYLAIWAPFFLLLGFEMRRVWRRQKSKVDWPAPQTVSIIIPTMNAAETIAECLDAVPHSDLVREVIVVDAGSRDDTVPIAKKYGVRVIVHDAPPERGGGRGGQLAAGLREATGDIAVLLHADTRLALGAITRMLQRLQRNPEVVGGALGSRFAGKGIAVRLIELANDLRASMLGVSFGDQVQFFRRQPVMAHNSYPAIPLMEDVELSLRLPQLGRTVFLWETCIVFAHQWRHNYAKRVWQVLSLCARYLAARMSGQVDTARLYREYYGDTTNAITNHRPTPTSNDETDPANRAQ